MLSEFLGKEDIVAECPLVETSEIVGVIGVGTSEVLAEVTGEDVCLVQQVQCAGE